LWSPSLTFVLRMSVETTVACNFLRLTIRSCMAALKLQYWYTQREIIGDQLLNWIMSRGHGHASCGRVLSSCLIYDP
jgi:hypothetical protein